MVHEHWDPDVPPVDRQPPDEEDFGLDTTEQSDQDWMHAEPGDDAADWLADVDTSATDSVDEHLATGAAGPYPLRTFAGLPRTVLVAAAAVGAVAVVIAAIRRRG